jgi:hypothetical protein
MTTQVLPQRTATPADLARLNSRRRTVAAVERRITHSRGRTSTHSARCPAESCGDVHFDFSSDHQAVTYESCGHFREVIRQGDQVQAVFEIGAAHA